MMNQEMMKPCEHKEQNIDMDKLIKQAEGSHVRQAMSKLAKRNALLVNLSNRVQVERIAAAQIVHLLEGWLNLSAALACLIRNEISQAKHLAYYGELRAVLSIIASSGMILIKNKLYYVDKECKINEIKGVHTHEVAWSFWENWIGSVNAKKFITNNIKLSESISLANIAESVVPLSSAHERLAKAWGYDLLEVAMNDHIARNRASYGIALALDDVSKKIGSYVPFLEKIWTLLMPYTNSIIRFDCALIKYIIKSVESGLKDSENDEGEATEDLSKCQENFIQMIADISSDSVRILSSFDKDDDLDIFKYAKEKKDDPENMISRCLIILRIATLALIDNMRGQENIERWMKLWLKKTVFFNETPDYDVANAICDYDCLLSELDMDKLTKPVASLAWGFRL